MPTSLSRSTVARHGLNVFVIGASGYIGRAVSEKLLAEGHSVIALARSEQSAARLPNGVRVLRGAVGDLATISAGLEDADAAIYLAIQSVQGASPADRATLDAITTGFKGSDRPLIVTSGLGVYAGMTTALVDEDTPLAKASAPQAWRVQLEDDLLAAVPATRTIILRPAMVYGRGSGSPILMTPLAHARTSGQAIHIGTGANLIPVVHVDDLAAAYVLALELAPAGTVINIAATALTGLDLARSISYAAALDGATVSLPLAVAQTTLGPLAFSLATEMKVSTVRATRLLGWTPAGPSLPYELMHGTLSGRED